MPEVKAISSDTILSSPWYYNLIKVLLFLYLSRCASFRISTITAVTTPHTWKSGVFGDNNRFIERIFQDVMPSCAPLFYEPFYGIFPVECRHHNISCGGADRSIYNRHTTIGNAGISHAIALYPDNEGGGGIWLQDTERSICSSS